MRMRQDVVKRINKLCRESDGIDIDVILMYEIIFNHMKETQTPVSKLKLELINGLLFIDGLPKERVAPLNRGPRIECGPEADYYENLILARDEWARGE